MLLRPATPARIGLLQPRLRRGGLPASRRNLSQRRASLQQAPRRVSPLRNRRLPPPTRERRNRTRIRALLPPPSLPRRRRPATLPASLQKPPRILTAPQ